MAKDKGGAEEEQDKLGRYLLQILAQEDTLKALEQKDFANQVTLVAILAQLDIRLSALRDALRGAGTRNFTTLETDIEAILARLNVNLSTRASETTLATQLNITLSALRDALKGASNKDLSTLEADLETVAGDTPALNDETVKGLLRSTGDAGAGPTNKTGKTMLKLLDEILTQTSDHAFGMMGYDYAGAAQAQLAVDPATKALLVKHTAPDHGACTGLEDDDHPQYLLVAGTRTADILIITDGAGHYLQVPKLTTAQRNALVASNGMIIYNTTTNQLEKCEAGAWGAIRKAEDLSIASQVAGDILYFNGTNWIRLGKDVGKYLKSGASAPAWDEATIGFSFAIPIDTPEEIGNDKGVFHFAPGVAGTIEEVYVMAKVAPGADKTLTVDVNKGGPTIFTTQGNRPSLVDAAKTATSGTPDVTTFAKNDLFTIDVDVSTATTAVADVVVLIRGKQKVA